MADPFKTFDGSKLVTDHADDLLSPHDRRMLLLALAETRGELGFTTQEGVALVNWATQAYANAAAADGAIAGRFAIDIDLAEGIEVTIRPRTIL